MITALLQKLEKVQPFTDKEAWMLFKIAAISEACGWTLLISGILFKRYITPTNNDPVLIAGQIHGTIFLIYIVAVVVLYSSLHWSRKRTVVAGLASIPPYGSLVFEQWAAYKRRGEALKTYREIDVRALIIQGNRILVIQPRDTANWQVPGGTVKAGEAVEQALERLVLDQTRVKPAIGNLKYIVQYRHKKTEHLDMFFYVTNPGTFIESELQANLKKLNSVDEMSYIRPEGNSELRPQFLQSEPIIKASSQPNGPVVSIRV